MSRKFGFTNNQKMFIALSLISALLVSGLFPASKKKNDTNSYICWTLNNYTLEDLKEIIYSSDFLTEEEKDYLYNSDFLSDILPFINESISNRIKYGKHFDNINIASYEEDMLGEQYVGYYTEDLPNALFVKNYDEFDRHKDTIAHEFVHLCQDITGYNLITEACAEIISSEYYEGSKANAYPKQVKLVKKLMEVIGSEVIWRFNFNGDFSEIEKSIKPYLTDEEYMEFVNALSFDYKENEENDIKFNRLDELIGILYKNKYGKDIEEDEVINAMDDMSKSLTRYYFNNRLINQENSYYIDRSDKELRRFTYQEAIDNILFMACTIKYEDVSFEEAMRILEEGEFSVNRTISDENAILYHKKDGGGKTYVTLMVNGIKYEDTDLDELAKLGIVNVNYKKVYFKELNAEEYLNKTYDKEAELFVLYSHINTTLYEDYIESYVPKKVYVEPISLKLTNKN